MQLQKKIRMLNGRDLSSQQHSLQIWSNKTIAEKSVPRTCRGRMKEPFHNHKLSFKHKRYSNKATFPSCMLHLKSVSSEKPNLKWSVLRCVPPYSDISKKCLLCWYEKLEIVTYQNQKELLNKRCELLCICFHPNKFLLKNYTGNSFI